MDQAQIKKEPCGMRTGEWSHDITIKIELERIASEGAGIEYEYPMKYQNRKNANSEEISGPQTVLEEQWSCLTRETYIENIRNGVSVNNINVLEFENAVSENCNSEESRSYKCDMCGKSFTWKGSLITHQVTHKKKRGEKIKRSKVKRKSRDLTVKEHECAICSTRFSWSSDLRKHLKIHTDDRPYECNVCKKRFRQNCDLNTHMMIHTGEKPFECSVCNKSFSQRGNLTKHLRSHTGEKPFECSICKKMFRQGSDLTAHVMIHTGEKPYACSLCGKSFSHSGNLTKHEKSHRRLINKFCVQAFD